MKRKYPAAFHIAAAVSAVALLVLSSCKESHPPDKVKPASASPSIPIFGYTIIHSYQHDPDAFTQGLEFHNGILFEGTGLEGHSDVRKVDFASGKVLAETKIPSYHFGEGITILHDKLYQITYTSQLGYVYDAKTLTKIDSFRYSGEGWGLTNDGTSLIMSNGSSTLQYLDPLTRSVTKTIEVTDGDMPQTMINELEYVDGAIYANVWRTDYIIRIDPATGKVTAKIDLSGILPYGQRTSKTDVLNGIAYHPDRKTFFITGKYWSRLFEVTFHPKEQ
jgi:glutamine cyclotransferase